MDKKHSLTKISFAFVVAKTVVGAIFSVAHFLLFIYLIYRFWPHIEAWFKTWF